MNMTATERATGICDNWFGGSRNNLEYPALREILADELKAHANAALERVAEIVRMYKVANFSIAPHHRLVPAEPDAASETMAAAILDLREEG